MATTVRLAWCLGIIAISILQPCACQYFPVLDHDKYMYHAIRLSPSSASDANTPDERAANVATHAGCQLLGRIGSLHDHYLLASPKRDLMKRHNHMDVAEVIGAHDHVIWTQQQIPTKRLYKRSGPPTHTNNTISTGSGSGGTVDQASAAKLYFESVTSRLQIKDPGLQHQWHLFNPNQLHNDINVTGVWEQGISGNGTVVCVLDDGVDYEHDDLKDNFNVAGSYDFNDNNPMPRPRLHDDRHGSRIAGEIAAARNNMCGIGVAYNAQISGVRILSADITEAQEAAAVNYAMDVNEIYSCSWGPSDDGRTVDGPGLMVQEAYRTAIEKGRRGLGVIYVFASGNGGGAHDTCNFDGYANSPYSITVAAIDRTNGHPTYSEACTAVLASMYSSGAGSYIFTTDKGNGNCAGNHGGTSAAAPIVSGILALVLEVRPDLSWRDVQHLVVNAAVPFNSSSQPDWEPTYHPERQFSIKFGFGRLDAYKIVQIAKTWKNVAPNTILTTNVSWVDRAIPQDADGISNIIEIGNDAIQKAGLTRIEHVQVVVTISHSRRGDIEVKLTSPNKIESLLAERRSGDMSGDGFQNWTFMTVKHWDEPPLGQWKLTVIDRVNPSKSGTWHSWYLKVWGESNGSTVIPPQPSTTSTATLASPSRGPSSTPNTISVPPSSGVSFAKWIIAGAVVVVLAGMAVVVLGVYKYGRKFFPSSRKRGKGTSASDSYEFKILDDDDEELDNVFGEYHDDAVEEDGGGGDGRLGKTDVSKEGFAGVKLVP
ncbi:hypothetical protein SeMB42_g02149 [Synchytrium endobioticum]|uniref:P/Homo B domain-containing protein n=1 Tax=Synchytrium endobioticum TaxID=286115 RepID=A0A507CPB2_9FUNG|nr:hypothetical protein SeLEV6574_g06309 [Synchytrium endobioticum]TPX50720.1 hypothetical protein SeMB42_g02149 [Synchytrium endobioticum]